MDQGLSNIGKEDRTRTRDWYKDNEKKKAFDKMYHVAANLSIHDTIIAKAKEIFAAWRTEKEQVTNRELVIAACLISAHRQLSQQVARDEAAKRLVTFT